MKRKTKPSEMERARAARCWRRHLSSPRVQPTPAGRPSIKHCTVFDGLSTNRQRSVYIATIEGNRLGERVSPVVILDFAGNIPEAIAAYDSGNYKEGERLLCNLA